MKLLKDGPDCSFDPSAGTAGTCIKPGSGSQDAYNLFYVEDVFLAQSILDQMKNVEEPLPLTRKDRERVVLHDELKT